MHRLYRLAWQSAMTDQQKTPTVEFTAMTINVGNGQAPDDQLIEALIAGDADIVAMQELNHRQAAFLRSALADHYPERYFFGDSYEGKGLLSRFPVTAAEPLNLVIGRPDVIARLDIAERQVTAIVGHPMPPRIGRHGIVFAHRSRRHIVQLGQRMRDASPAIMLGDFNMTPRHAAHARFRRLGLHDAFGEAGESRGATFPVRLGPVHGLGTMGKPGQAISRLPLVPVVRYDYIWHTGEFETVAAWIGPDAGSDHLPVMARLRFHTDLGDDPTDHSGE